ncbi:hypothetical protein LJC11_04660 [Bacteroidales bacterium OttesenSCG-928-I21]|nr:hypothetical protein [Bacteroidales bacterium OttesenSCG-928-I21]
MSCCTQANTRLCGKNYFFVESSIFYQCYRRILYEKEKADSFFIDINMPEINEINYVENMCGFSCRTELPY